MTKVPTDGCFAAGLALMPFDAARRTGPDGSHRLAPMAEADAFAILPGTQAIRPPAASSRFCHSIPFGAGTDAGGPARDDRRGPMHAILSRRPITALVYADGAGFEPFLRGAASALVGRGLRLAGLVQRSIPKPNRTKCDMYLEDLATGALHRISGDRGPHARGCMLDPDLLLRACAAAEAGLTAETDVLVLCKFGKAEAEGGGFRALIAQALDLGVPIVIGVPLVNLMPFRAYAEGLAQEIELEEADPGWWQPTQAINIPTAALGR